MASTINASTSSGIVQTADTSGVLQIQTANTTAVTVDSTQNVGIGTTSPSTKLHVKQTNDSLPALQLQHGDGDFILMEEGGGTDLFKFTRVAGTNDLQINNLTANNIRFATNNTEYMRLDSSGNLMLSGTSAVGRMTITSATGYTYASVSYGNGAEHFIFKSDSTTVGSITRVGGSGVAYNTSSDYRLKENVEPLTNALAKITQLKPCTYTWKLDGSKGQGFIAHELAEVIPDAVSGEKDALEEDGTIKPQGIDQSRIVATLVAAVQELTSKVISLEAQLGVK